MPVTRLGGELDVEPSARLFPDWVGDLVNDTRPQPPVSTTSCSVLASNGTFPAFAGLGALSP